MLSSFVKRNFAADYYGSLPLKDSASSGGLSDLIRNYLSHFLKGFVPFLFVLYVVSLSCSMAGMEIFAWSVTFFFLVYAFLDRHNAVKFHPLGIEIPVIFLITVVVLGLRVNAPEGDFIFAFGRLRNLALLFVFTYCFQLIKEPRKLFYLLIGCGGIISIYGIWQHYSGIDIWRHDHRALVLLPWTTEKLYATVGFFNHHLTYAHSFAMILCGVWAFLLLNKKAAIWVKALFAAALVFIPVSHIFTYARGVWLALMVSVPMMAFLVNRKFAGIILVGILAIGAVLYAANPVFRDRAHSIIEDNYKSNVERRKLWAANYEMFLEHPLLGVGYSQNERETMEYYKKLGIVDGMAGHAHNNYIEFLATTGILGFICYLFFAGILLFKTYLCYARLAADQLWDRILLLTSLGAQVTFHIGGFTQFNFGDSKVQHQFIFWAALACYHIHKIENSNEGPQETTASVAPLAH